MICYALDRAKEELKDEIEKYSIIVDSDKGIIGWNSTIMQITPGTTKVICRRWIKYFIKQSKERREKRARALQLNMFGELE